MASIITQTTTFNPIAKTLDFSAWNNPTFEIERILAVYNKTRDVFIYSVGSDLTGYTAFSSNVMTLAFDTSTQNSLDTLQIFYNEEITKVDGTSDLSKIAGNSTRNVFRCTFNNSIASGVAPDLFTIIRSIGTGQTVSQSAGNLVLTSGTTVNQETALRSVQSFTGSMITRVQTILSQRIANNNFLVELVDVIGDGLVCTINSATSITVTIPETTFTAQNVGQGMYLGMYSGTGTFAPQRAVIASVSGNNITYTVAGMTVGVGTCSVFGWNYYQSNYAGALGAIAVSYDTQRKGWNSGALSTPINTTASPGHMAIMQNDDGNAYYSDQLIASSVTPQAIQRGSRVVNLPEENTPLFLQIRMVNGTTAPASTTTWTIGMASIEKYSPVPITINNVKPNGTGNLLYTQLLNSSVGITSPLALAIPASPAVLDIASGAITTSATTGTIAPTSGCSYQCLIFVSAVAGTLPTYDVNIEESDDGGTSWFVVYSFPRITTTGQYRSPKLPLRGNRIRYVQTVGGTTPSFTRSLIRMQSNDSVSGSISQLFDRSIVLTTLNSVSPALNVQNAKHVQLVVNVGAITTTAPQLQLEGSDDNGTTWYAIGTPLTAVASSTVQATFAQFNAQLIRARASTAGVGVTAGYVLLKGF